MYTHLASKKLHTGEPLEIGVVVPPDEAFAPLVKPFLAHKYGGFGWHIAASFEPDRIHGLETRFYLGLIDGVPISNIMTVEYEGIGILGHVFTAVPQRRKGACRLVMAEQMADFQRRGGRYLTLGTGYDTHPYWIYHSFGFRSILPESGFMKFTTDEAFEARYFADGNVNVVTSAWQDWPVMNVLCAQKGPPYLRSVAYELYGPRNFEGGYLTFLQRLQTQDGYDARLLKSHTGAIVGYAMIQPDNRWNGRVLLLDLCVHPNFIAHAHTLLQALPLPEDRKIQCYAELDTDWKIAALLEEGFEHEATFRDQLTCDGQSVDVEVYERQGVGSRE